MNDESDLATSEGMNSPQSSRSRSLSLRQDPPIGKQSPTEEIKAPGKKKKKEEAALINYLKQGAKREHHLQFNFGQKYIPCNDTFKSKSIAYNWY